MKYSRHPGIDLLFIEEQHFGIAAAAGLATDRKA
jgi:hypothetical protein